MAPTPRSSLSDDFAVNLNCPICGEARLAVQHTAALPDYVTCANCASAFVVEEGGERILYGKINDKYPRTQQMALKQWVLLEAIARRASDERQAEAETHSPVMPERPAPEPMEVPPSPPAAEDLLRSAAVPIPTEPDLHWPPEKLIPLEPEPESAARQPEQIQPSPPAPEPVVQKPAEAPASPTPPRPPQSGAPVGIPEAIGSPEIAADRKEPPVDTPVFPQGMKLKVPPDSAVEQPPPSGPMKPAAPQPQAPTKAAPEPTALELHKNDPPPGIRHRVVIRGEKVLFPRKACAHCQATPVRGRLSVIGDLPQGQKIGQRKRATFNLPLCADCHDRARNISPEEKNERLQANLLATLVAMVLLVAALAWGVDLQENPLPSVIILAILAIIGYSVPAYILLGRIRQLPPSPNSAYIRSTLLIPDDSQGLETAFEFRNQDYATQFFHANELLTLGKPAQVKDRALTKPRPPETPAS